MSSIRQNPQESIVAAEARIAALEIERQAKIEAGEGDFAGAVARIDAEIATLRSRVAVYQQRAEAIERRARQQAARAAEQQRLAGIAAVKSRLNRRVAAARKLDTSIGAVRDAFAELLQADVDLFADWPAGVSHLGQMHHFHIACIEALSARRQPRPPSAGLVRSLAEHAAFNLAAAIEKKNAELVEMIEGASAADGAAA